MQGPRRQTNKQPGAGPKDPGTQTNSQEQVPRTQRKSQQRGPKTQAVFDTVNASCAISKKRSLPLSCHGLLARKHGFSDRPRTRGSTRRSQNQSSHRAHKCALAARTWASRLPACFRSRKTAWHLNSASLGGASSKLSLLNVTQDKPVALTTYAVSAAANGGND